MDETKAEMGRTPAPGQNACPRCGQKMNAGFVLGHDAIRWAKDESQGAFLGIRAERLSSGIGFFANPRLPGLRCEGCRIVIFEY